MEEVIFKGFHENFNTGKLTGNMEGIKHEVLLPNGNIVYLYQNEFVRKPNIGVWPKRIFNPKL